MSEREKISRRRYIEIIGGTVAGLAVGAALGYIYGTTISPPKPVTKPTPRSIKMGYTMGMTGPLAVPNAWCDKYRILFTEIVNEKGGLYVAEYGERLPIELVKYDDRGSTDEMAKYYERLATVDRVHVFLTSYGTFVAPVVNPIATKYKIPYILGSAMPLPDLKSTWTVWTTPIVFASYELIDLLKKLGISDVYLAVIETKFGLEFRRNFVEGFRYKDEVYEGLKDTGIKIVAEKLYPIGTTDFTSIILDAKAKNPDAFIQFSYPDDSYACTKQMIELDYNPKFYYTSLGLACPTYYKKFTAKELEGITIYGQTYVPSAPWKDPYIGSCRDFFDKFKERWGEEPDINDTNNDFVAISIAAQAIEKAGTLDGEAINKVLHKETFSTIYGPIKFDEYGIITKDCPAHTATVLQWQKGELQVVSPPQSKTAELIYPKPRWPR
jgi:branched-chain amino acid transport system substrate-binding protein